MTTWLDDAWFEGAFQALQDTLKVDARLRRDMIQFLFDEGFWDPEKLTWPAAEARFYACLSRTKADATFKIGELWALMKRFGRHQFFLAMAQDLGYEVRRQPTDERLQDLLTRVLDVQERYGLESTGLHAEIQRVAQQPQTAGTVTGGAFGSRPRLSRGERAP